MQEQISPISPQTTIPSTSTAQLSTPKHVDISVDRMKVAVNEAQLQNRVYKIGQNQKQATEYKQEQQKQLNQPTLKTMQQNLNVNISMQQMYCKEQNNQDTLLCCVIEQKIDIFSIFYISNNHVQKEVIKDSQQETRREQQPQQMQIESNPEQNNEQTNKQTNHQHINKEEENETTNKGPQKIQSDDQKSEQNCPQNSASNSLSQSSQQSLKQLLSQIQKSAPPCPQLLPIPQYNQQSQFNLYYQYRKFVLQTLQTKCPAEKMCDYIQISFSQYKKILTVWENLEQAKLKDHVGVDGFLRFGDLRRLAYGRWVNDVIMSAYVTIINARITDHVIFDSLKVTSIFSKKDPKQITRLLQKSNPITQITPTPILIIHHNNHWFFLQLPPSCSASTTITIYNSLAYKISSYSSIPLLKQIIDYFSMKYDRKLSYKICQNYPLQNNDCDCGVMAICGIRDVVRKCIVWSFDFKDIGYKRVLITRELLAGCPVDF